MIRELIATADSTISNEDLALSLLDSLMKLSLDEMRSELLPLIHNAVRLSRRNVARSTEQSSGDISDPVKKRRDLLEESFFVSPERGYVSWGEATVEDHLTRAGFIRTMASGLVMTAKKHEDTAKLLRARSVKCLYELGQVAA